MPTPKLTTALVCTLLCTTALAQQKGTLTDTRDGKKYKTVKIGEQVWFAENLNYEAGSICYDYEPANCNKYGRLYNWNTAKTVCPKSWHLPSNAEWDILYHYVDSTNGTGSPYESKTAGKFLKATSGWNSSGYSNGNGTNAYGFSALPGGIGYSTGHFSSIGDYGYWWSTSEINIDYAYSRSIDYHTERARYYDDNKNLLFSVRCVKD